MSNERLYNDDEPIRQFRAVLQEYRAGLCTTAEYLAACEAYDATVSEISTDD